MASKALSIYVGSDNIRVAEVIYNGKTVTLANAAEIATPEKSITDGFVEDVNAVAEAIRTAVFGRGFTSKDVIFTIASKKIASKEVTIPFIKQEKKLQSVLQANSAEYFPMSNMGDYSFAYTMLEDYTDAEGHKCRVSAVACPVDLVKGYYEIARELKYRVQSIDYFGNSVLQLLSLQMTPGRVDLVLQIENDQTIVNVMRGSTLVFQRSVAYGKNSVISSLMDVKKISEKDAKTLLSKDDYMEQYVTEDEYSAALEFLINGIKKAVEYYRNKVKEENLQGIRVFGEGSTMAGIGKMLEKELGANVEFFDNLSGVIVKGQAGLKASEVLRYLPNMGAIIKPVDFSLEVESSTSSVDNALIIKVLRIAFIISFVVMAGWVTYTIIDGVKVNKEKEEIQAKITAIEDIEEIANLYDRAEAELAAVTTFQDDTYNNNELLLRFIEDMEKMMPTDTEIQSVKAEDGLVEFEVTSGWHPTTKNEVADVIVSLGGLDYVYDLSIPEIEENYIVAVVLDYDAAGNAIIMYDVEEDTDNPAKSEVKIHEYDEEEDGPDAKTLLLVQTTYDFECLLSPVDPYAPIEEEVPADAVIEDADATEEGGVQ